MMMDDYAMYVGLSRVGVVCFPSFELVSFKIVFKWVKLRVQ
jgi:hypothetical protein